jgi:hypothetical protein
MNANTATKEEIKASCNQLHFYLTKIQMSRGSGQLVTLHSIVTLLAQRFQSLLMESSLIICFVSLLNDCLLPLAEAHHKKGKPRMRVIHTEQQVWAPFRRLASQQASYVSTRVLQSSSPDSVEKMKTLLPASTAKSCDPSPSQSNCKSRNTLLSAFQTVIH